MAASDSRQRYERVPARPADPEESEALRRAMRLRVRSVGREASRLCHIFMWLGAAAFVVVSSQLPRVVAERDPRVRWALVYAAGAALAYNSAALLYISMWLPVVRGLVIHEPFEYAPRLIISVSALGVAAYALLCAGFWPVWGLVTPVMFAVLFVAALFFVALMPPWLCPSPPADEPGEEDVAVARAHAD